MFVSMVGIATLSAYTAYATKQRVEPPAAADAHGPFAAGTTSAGTDRDTRSSTMSAAPNNRATTTRKAVTADSTKTNAESANATAESARTTATSPLDAAADSRAAIDREQRLGRTLVIAGLAALVFACSGLLLVGARRRLW
jgi:hypothetical protein